MKSTILLPLLLLMAVVGLGQTAKRNYVVSAENTAAVVPNVKVLKTFRRAFPEVENEKWSIGNGYHFASFDLNNVKHKIVFTKNGQVDYSLKIYGENQLPPEVKAKVKSTYYDYKITNAQELLVKGNTIYLVKITNVEKWKTIRVSEGEVEEIENYSTVISPCR